MALNELFEWAEQQTPALRNVVPAAVAIVRDKSNISPYRIAGDPVLDYAAAGEAIFRYRRGRLVGWGRFAFTDRQDDGRIGRQDLIEFEIDRDGSARMRLHSWGGSVRELTEVVVENGPFEGTFFRGYFDRGVSGAGLVTMSFDRAQETTVR
jgi:hypothetical protein